MKRRTFLQSLAATAAAAPIMLNGIPVRAKTPLPLLAQMQENAADKILIIVQLFGGNDGLNTIIPADDPAYQALRPKIGIQPLDAIKVGPIYMNDGLGRGSRGGMVQLLNTGYAAVVREIGYTPANLSHFRSTDIWLSGIIDSDPNHHLSTGWVGRMLEKQYPTFPASLPPDPLAIQVGGFSLALTSTKGRMGVEVGDPSKQLGVSSFLDATDANAMGTHYSDEYAFIDDVAKRSNTYALNIRTAYAAGKAKLKATYGSDGFGQQMASVAALIAGGLKTKVYVVSMGGFDTHVSQQTDGKTGLHPTLLSRLGDGCAQFMYDMVALGEADRVIGLTISEFGRRPAENGSLGTDHGAASVQFVFGTQVSSGVFQLQPLDLANLDENGDLPMQIDYRRTYMDVLTKWFGLTLADARIILQLPPDDITVTPLGVIKPQAGIDGWKVGQPSTLSLSNYPNPFSTNTTLQLTLESATDVTIDLSNVAGQRLGRVIQQHLAAGVHQIPLDAMQIAGRQLASGTYVCTVIAGSDRISKMIQCVR